MPDYKIYLKDILEAIEKIEESIGNLSKEEFKRNIDKVDATIMRIQVIGESIKKLPKEFKEKYKKIEWEKISETRDIISHAYFKVNLDIIWDLINNKLHKLKEQIIKLI